MELERLDHTWYKKTRRQKVVLDKREKRRSTIEVRPEFYEDP